MDAIDLALGCIREHEGCVLHPYQDAKGVWTIGWGNTRDARGVPVLPNTKPLTQAQADALLLDAVDAVEQNVLRYLDVAPTQHELAALISFTYNVGITAFANSTLLKLFNKGDYAGAAEQFPAWVYSGGKVLAGLVRRRADERALFLTPD